MKCIKQYIYVMWYCISPCVVVLHFIWAVEDLKWFSPHCVACGKCNVFLEWPWCWPILLPSLVNKFQIAAGIAIFLVVLCSQILIDLAQQRNRTYMYLLHKNVIRGDCNRSMTPIQYLLRIFNDHLKSLSVEHLYITLPTSGQDLIG